MTRLRVSAMLPPAFCVQPAAEFATGMAATSANPTIMPAVASLTASHGNSGLKTTTTRAGPSHAVSRPSRSTDGRSNRSRTCDH
jgi:hypothetical protein